MKTCKNTLWTLNAEDFNEICAFLLCVSVISNDGSHSDQQPTIQHKADGCVLLFTGKKCTFQIFFLMPYFSRSKKKKVCEYPVTLYRKCFKALPDMPLKVGGCQWNFLRTQGF